MTDRIKIRPTIFLPYDYDKEEACINTMSQKGWQLVKGGLFHHTYIQSDQRYRYKLDYNNKVNFSPEEYNRYLSLFSEQGWEQINSTINGWHYFRKKYDPALTEEEYEIYTDDISLREMLSRWSRIARIFQIIFMIFVVINTVMFLTAKDLLAITNVITEIIAIIMFEVCILNVRRKQVFSKSGPTPGFYGGYILLGAFFLILLFSFFLIFFGLR